MVHTSSNCIAIFVVLLALLASKPASADDQNLEGCWRGERVVQYFKDGTSRANESSTCSMQFLESRILTHCVGPNGMSVIEYKYRVVRPGTYLATMSSHTSRPELVGGTREYDYRLADERLFITTNPQTTNPAPPTAAVRVESVSVRASCE